MSEPLFREFEEVSAKQWKQKIQFELKGEDYNEKLVTKSGMALTLNLFITLMILNLRQKFPLLQHGISAKRFM